MTRRMHGFTLIELMITVAIIAILASVAYPSYRDSVAKGRRAEARAALADLLQQQERYLTQRNTYKAFAAGSTAADVPFKTWVGNSLATATYRIGAQACDAAVPINQCVRLFAQPQFADPQAGTLRIQSSGIKDCINATKPALCWP